MRVFVAALVFALLPGTGMMNTEAPEAIDEAAAMGTLENSGDAVLQQIIDTQVHAWNHKDAAAFASTFSEDALFISVRGDRVTGRPAIEANHAFIFNGPYRSSTITMTVESVLHPADNVAVVDAECVVRGFDFLPPGIALAEPGVLNTRMRYVVENRDGLWTIIAAQNTVVTPAPMPGLKTK